MKIATIPETVQRLVFVISSGNGSLKSVSSGQLRIGKNNRALECPFTGLILPGAPFASVVEIYRKDGVWRLGFTANSLSKEHFNFIREKLRKPAAVKADKPPVLSPVVPPPPPKPSAPVTPPPAPKSSEPAVNKSNPSQRKRTLAEGFPYGNIWVLGLLPNIEKQPVPPKCYQKLNHLFWRHLLWTLWFWIPFGPVLGWIHLALKSFHIKYLANAALYSLVLLVPYSNGFWQVNIFAWLIGLIHCYKTFESTFLYMIESTDGRHYEPKKIGNQYNLNTINYKTFGQTGWEGWENIALPILIERHTKSQFLSMPSFLGRIKNWMEPAWEKGFSSHFYVEVETNPTEFFSKGMLFVAPFLLLCIVGCAWGVYTISPPQIQQQVHSFLGWDFYKIVQGIGSGVNRNEALQRAKIDAIGNALGTTIDYKETGGVSMTTVSDDQGDTNKASQKSKEDYAKQVEGKISDVEIISESQSDGLFYVTIKAKVLMNKKEPTK